MLLSHQITQRSADTASLLGAARSVYVVTNRTLGGAWKTITLVIFGIPAILALRIIFLFFRKSIQKDIRKVTTQSLDNLESYQDLRFTYDKLTQAIDAFDKVSSVKSPTKIPFLAKGVLADANKIFVLIRDYHGKLENTIQALDEKAPKPKVFSLITEGELWRNRTKAVEYMA